MNMNKPTGRVAYEPSSLAADSPRETPRGFQSFAAQESGERGRVRAEAFADHYSQARMFFCSQSAPEQAHLASALVFELSKVQTPHVRSAIVGHLRHIDAGLAQRVATGLAMPSLPAAPPAAAPVLDMDQSPALQIIGKMKNTLEGRCVAILIHTGSDAGAIAAIRKAVLAAGATVKMVAPSIGEVVLSDNSSIAVDGQLAGTPSVLFDAIAVLLSAEGAGALCDEAAAIDFVRDAFGHLKAISLDAGGQALLHKAGVVPDAGVIDAPETAAFIHEARTRQWAREPGVRTLA